ncbi:MAG: BrnA antitoxin family protein [Terracidiphilus sp.]
MDCDVADWFKARGKGHLTRMNAVLRAYVNAQSRNEQAASRHRPLKFPL